jgi:hypothetical protein
MSRRVKIVLAAACVLALVALLVVLSRGSSPGVRADDNRTSLKTAIAYQFLSPSTEENLSLEQACRRLRSEDHVRSRCLAGEILGQIGVERYQVLDAIGDCSDGAENSIMVVIPDPPDFATLRYATAWFGLLADQKTVLTFRGEGGPDAVYQLDVPEQDLAELREVLDRHGVRFRTILPTKQGHRVLVYDAGCQLWGNLERLGSFYDVRVEVTPGTGECIGEETRVGAQQKYLQLIRDYEMLPRRLNYRPTGCQQAARRVA